MIGAMPAIAVRCDRKKGDGSIGYFNRPNKLVLHFRPPLTHHQVTPSPSPITSPQGIPIPETTQHRFARHCASKRFVFQLSVLAPLAGVLLLFIGLVQLAPGAEGGSYGLPLIIVGTGILLFGMLVIAIRILCKWELRKTGQPDPDPLPEIKINDASCDGVDLEKGETERLVVENTSPTVNIKEKEGNNDEKSQQGLKDVLVVGGKQEDKEGGPFNSTTAKLSDADKKV